MWLVGSLNQPGFPWAEGCASEDPEGVDPVIAPKHLIYCLYIRRGKKPH